MRKRELPLAAIDREWPHQVAVPAKTSLGGCKIVLICAELSLCPRGHSGVGPDSE